MIIVGKKKVGNKRVRKKILKGRRYNREEEMVGKKRW